MKFQFAIGGFEIRFGRSQPPAAPRPRKRSFSGAAGNRLTNDWQSPATSADAELQYARKTLIFRCRQLERDNDYVRRYLKLVGNNVLGAYGIGLQLKVESAPGVFDKPVNTAIEKAWKKWGKRKTASLNQRYSWRRMERLILRSLVRDGGVLVRIIRTSPTLQNPFGFTLQLLEIDYLDHDLNRVEPNGNEIRMGVEMDATGRVVNYHVLNRHPGDTNQIGRKRVVIPASDMLHITLPERVGQTIGLPSLVSSMLRLNMLGGYEEAEVTAAREGACKGGYIQNEAGEEFTGDGEDPNGNTVLEMEPGVIRELAPGQTFVEHDPKHPNSAYGPFVKQVLRGLAAGLGVSYVSLANDLEGVNYSSIRAGLLDEREEWKELQESIIEALHEEIFEAWLEWSLLNGAIVTATGAELPLAKQQTFNAPEWKPRRWPWVDPMKDMLANVLAVEKGFSSRRAIISEAGGDVETVFLEQSEDAKLAKSYGLEFPLDGAAAAAAGNNLEDDDPETPGEDEDPDEDELDPQQKPRAKAKPVGKATTSPAPKSSAPGNAEFKSLVDAYGVAVRAGLITPTPDDEAHFRNLLKLPAVTPAVTAAWQKDGEVRRPITLVQKDGASPAPAAPPTEDES